MAEPSPADITGSADPAPAGDDGRLIQKAGRGDHNAMALLAARYELMLLGLAQGLLRGREDLARDVVQDVWIRVLRSGSAFSGNSSAKTWLYRVTINRCHDVRAKMNRQAPADSVRPVAERPFDAEQSTAVSRAVETLKPDQRMLVVLCYHSGMTHTQAADILGVPVGTIKSRLNTALNDLRAALASSSHPHTHEQGAADARPARRPA
ncbi:MAG TPA: RNA polymerase sigma factor [Phycisphaerales bacterium]|nr:RNA polymerase sigma factor [Phycisphaerales bacterium]